MIELTKTDNSTQAFYYRSDATTERGLAQDFRNFWVELLTRIRAARDAGTWNRIVFECWCELGYVIAYPQLRGDSPAIKRPHLTLSLDYLNSTKASLEATEDESAISSILALAYIVIRQAIVQAYKRDPALSEVKNTLAETDFTCWTTVDANSEKLMKFELLF